MSWAWPPWGRTAFKIAGFSPQAADWNLPFSLLCCLEQVLAPPSSLLSGRTEDSVCSCPLGEQDTMQLGDDWTVVNISPYREHCFLHTESVLSVNVELGI